jgi:hypothetical protein
MVKTTRSKVKHACRRYDTGDLLLGLPGMVYIVWRGITQSVFVTPFIVGLMVSV